MTTIGKVGMPPAAYAQQLAMMRQYEGLKNRVSPDQAKAMLDRYAQAAHNVRPFTLTVGNYALVPPPQQEMPKQEAPQNYKSNVMLSEEEGVEKMLVEKETVTKKGSTVTHDVAEVPTRLSPQEVEQKIMSDPAFRAQMEAKLGGKIVYDGTPDGSVVVERGPGDPNAPPADPAQQAYQQGFQQGYGPGMNVGMQNALANHLLRMDTGLRGAMTKFGPGPTMSEWMTYKRLQQLGLATGASRMGSNWGPGNYLGGVTGFNNGYLSQYRPSNGVYNADTMAQPFENMLRTTYDAQQLMNRAGNVFSSSRDNFMRETLRDDYWRIMSQQRNS